MSGISILPAPISLIRLTWRLAYVGLTPQIRTYLFWMILRMVFRHMKRVGWRYAVMASFRIVRNLPKMIKRQKTSEPPDEGWYLLTVADNIKC